MKSITKIIKILAVVVALLFFITVSFAAVQASSASEEPSENKETSINGKYSKFFDEKTKWCDALIITCNDFRFTSATQKFVNERLRLGETTTTCPSLVLYVTYSILIPEILY